MVTALIGGIYGGTKFVIYYYINLKQLYIDIIQFPPPPPNTSPRKSKEALKTLLIRAFLYILIPTTSKEILLNPIDQDL